MPWSKRKDVCQESRRLDAHNDEGTTKDGETGVADFELWLHVFLIFVIDEERVVSGAAVHFVGLDRVDVRYSALRPRRSALRLLHDDLLVLCAVTMPLDIAAKSGSAP